MHMHDIYLLPYIVKFIKEFAVYEGCSNIFWDNYSYSLGKKEKPLRFNQNVHRSIIVKTSQSRNISGSFLVSCQTCLRPVTRSNHKLIAIFAYFNALHCPYAFNTIHTCMSRNSFFIFCFHFKMPALKHFWKKSGVLFNRKLNYFVTSFTVILYICYTFWHQLDCTRT